MESRVPYPRVIYEDRDFLVVNKPAGLQVHAARVAAGRGSKDDKGGASHGPTLVDWLAAHAPEVKTVGDDPALRPGIVHRLDKDTSGVMVIAKNQPTFNFLKERFQKHEVKKTYLALVRGVPKEKQGTIDAPIGIRSGTLKRSVRSTKMAKAAVTEYRVLKSVAGEAAPDGSLSLLAVVPRTGRTHQIRVHLTDIGHPVVGDRLYGPKTKLASKEQGVQEDATRRLMLHALSLEFTASNGRRMKFEADPPEAFTAVIHNAFGPQSSMW